MAIVLIAPTKDNLPYWQQELQAEGQRQGLETEVLIGPEQASPEKVKMAVVWKHKPESLHAFPHLKLVSSMGAGVDHILKDPDMPADWQVCRIVDEQLTNSMSKYLLAAVLNHHKKLWDYTEKQRERHWAYTDEAERPVNVGILGMGELGQDIARKLVALDFPVFGYSNSPKHIPGVESFSGEQALPAFLQEVNLLICLLPLTLKTEGFLDKRFFQACRPGTFLINVARGEHLVEQDLIPALDKGLLSGALLDVFRQEPLPKEHPFWQRRDIRITPHIASITKPDAAIPQIVENYKRLLNGSPLLNEVDRKKGY